MCVNLFYLLHKYAFARGQYRCEAMSFFQDVFPGIRLAVSFTSLQTAAKER